MGAIVDELELGALAQRLVGDLPFGTQKRVELARALATNPSLLLLDEPAAGLNHEEVDELGGVIRRIRDGRRISILLVEHHMGLVMSLSDHVVALNFGRKIGEGTPSKVQADESRCRRLSRRHRAMTALLSVKGLTASYGDGQVLSGVDFEVSAAA